MLELSARPDTAHVLGALGGMVYNVCLKIAIYCGVRCAGQNPGLWLSDRVMAARTLDKYWAKARGQRVDMIFRYYVSYSFLFLID